ncbi:MAG: FitA-like ribbon-helix-helix domain-containing protein [bacterium]
MKAITVRGIDSSLAEKLKQAAKERGKSVNQFIIETLKESLGIEKQKKFTVLHHDLDQLFGSWSEDEFENIQKKINNERKIDKELW